MYHSGSCFGLRSSFFLGAPSAPQHLNPGQVLFSIPTDLGPGSGTVENPPCGRSRRHRKRQRAHLSRPRPPTHPRHCERVCSRGTHQKNPGHLKCVEHADAAPGRAPRGRARGRAVPAPEPHPGASVRPGVPRGRFDRCKRRQLCSARLGRVPRRSHQTCSTRACGSAPASGDKPALSSRGLASPPPAPTPRSRARVIRGEDKPGVTPARARPRAPEQGREGAPPSGRSQHVPWPRCGRPRVP